MPFNKILTNYPSTNVRLYYTTAGTITIQQPLFLFYCSSRLEYSILEDESSK